MQELPESEMARWKREKSQEEKDNHRRRDGVTALTAEGGKGVLNGRRGGAGAGGNVTVGTQPYHKNLNILERDVREGGRES